MQFGQFELQEVAAATLPSRKKSRTEVRAPASFVSTSAVATPANNTTTTTPANMTVSTGKLKSFSRDDLRVLDLLDHPIWVFDIVNKSMWWGNSLAVEYWNAQSLDELINRNFADDMSEAVHKKNLDTLERLRRNERVSESVRCSNSDAGWLVGRIVLFLCPYDSEVTHISTRSLCFYILVFIATSRSRTIQTEKPKP